MAAPAPFVADAERPRAPADSDMGMGVMNRLGFGLFTVAAFAGCTCSAEAHCNANFATTDGQVITCTPNSGGVLDQVIIGDGRPVNNVQVNISAGAGTAAPTGSVGVIVNGDNWKINNQGRIQSDVTGILINGNNARIENLSGGTISSIALGGGLGADGMLKSATLDNAAGATISGGVISADHLTLTNAGTIQDVVGEIVAIRTVSGSVTNLAGGIISGVEIDSINALLTNAGRIQNSGDSPTAVTLTGGTLQNLAGGVISGDTGVRFGRQGRLYNAAGASIVTRGFGVSGDVAVWNAGLIKSDIVAVSGTSVVNASGGVISGGNVGVITQSPQSIGRQSVLGSPLGAMDPAPLTVSNASGATISGGTTGVWFFSGGALTNLGTIMGGGHAVDFSGSAASSTVTNYGRIVGDVRMGDGDATLAIATGSTITGRVDAGQFADGMLHPKEVQLIGSGADTLNGDAFHGFNLLSVNAPGGSWTLAGNSIFSLGTKINAGVLFVNGSLASNVVDVLSGGALGGNGTVVGSVWFQPGSIYRVNVDGARASKLTVNAGPGDVPAGLVEAGGTVNATFGPGGVVVGHTYTVLTAALGGGVLGKFAGVNTGSAFLSAALSYDPQNVFLRFDRNAVRFASVGQTGNQAAVGAAFDRVGVVSGSPLFNSVLLGSADQARSTFDSVSGEGLAGAHNAAFRASALFTSSVNDQATAWRMGRDGSGNAVVAGGDGALGYAPEEAHASVIPFTKAPAPARFERTWRAWGAAFGGTGALRGDAALGTASQTDSLFGGNIGLDYQVWPNWLVGVAFGGSEGNFSVTDRATSGKVDGVHGGIYSMLALNQLYVSNATTISSFGNKTTRATGGFGGLARETESGDFRSWELRSRFEVGRDFSIAGARLTPFAAFEIAQLYSNGFTESSLTAGGTPGSLALSVGRQTTTSAPLFLGVRGERRFELADGLAVTPQASVAWVHEFSPARNLNGALVSLPGASFIVNGARPASDAAQVNAGAQLDVTHYAALFASFEGEFSNIAQTYAGKGGVRMAW